MNANTANRIVSFGDPYKSPTRESEWLVPVVVSGMAGAKTLMAFPHCPDEQKLKDLVGKEFRL
jgi:hypothetical protein